MATYIIIIGLALMFPSFSCAQLNNLIWANLPIEKQLFMADEDTKSYKTDTNLFGIGNFYISFEKKKIIVKGIEPLSLFTITDTEMDKPKFEFLHEEFVLTKVIKLDEVNYAFEGKRVGYFERKCTGKLKIRKTSLLTAEVAAFEMLEMGKSYKGVMNKYSFPESNEAKILMKQLKMISFGSSYAAMGDDSVSY